jgi:hypothetical protein
MFFHWPSETRHGRLFQLVVFLRSPVAFAEVLERAAPQMLDGQSQSKLLATICYGFRLAIICQWRMRRTKRHRILQPVAMRIATFGCGHGCPLLSGRGKPRLALRTDREVSLASKKVAQFQGAIPFRAQLHPRAWSHLTDEEDSHERFSMSVRNPTCGTNEVLAFR